MKLDKLKKFFRVKRFLALALAAAMTVTSLPQTAYAAEADTPETETAVEVQEEEQKQPAWNTEENKESDPSEAETEEVVSSVTQAAETNVEEDVDKNTDGSEAKETDAREAENQAEGDGVTEAAYMLDASALESDNEVMTAVYDGGVKFGGSTPSYSILSKIVIKKDGAYDRLLSNASGFTYKWQKQGTDSTSADTEFPVNAGSYQLVITPIEGGTYASANEITISGFVINKADVEIDFEIDPIIPGTAKDKVKDSIEDVAVYANKGRVFTYDPEDGDTKLTVTVTVTDPYKTGDNNETSDTVLKKNGDYSAKVTVDFSSKATDEEKGNYNLPQSLTKRITVAELKGTTVSLENVADATAAERSDNRATVKVISKTYGEEVSVPTYTPKVKEKEPVIDNDGKEQYNDVTTTDADFSGAWHSAEFRSWTESVAVKNDDGTEKTDENGDVVYEIKTFCSLTVGGELGEGKKPTEAGAYVYRVSYNGDKEQYAGSYADIVVEIAPVEVEVVPQAMEGATFYAGETVESVLSQISWKLDKTINAENIWGTSYDNAYKTQPYEPVFAVYRVKDNVAESKPMSSADMLTKAEGVEYQVRFTGKKAVRNESGYSSSYSDIKDINDETVDSFNCNYKTSTDETKNALTLTLSAKEVTIDVTPITSDAALAAAGLKKSDITIDGNAIYTKVFSEDGGLYESRADYKKALPDTGELTYKWYKWRRSYDLNETYVEVFNGDWDFKSTGNWIPLSVNSEDFDFNKSSLKNAGIYKLEITYDDGEAYAQENVYYAIEQQQLRYVPTNALPTARYGADTQDYITSMTNDPNFSPKLQIRPNNTGEWTDLTGWIEDIDYGIYSDYWYVEAKAPEKEGENPDWEGWRWMYSFVQRTGEEGQTVDQNKYRLAKDVDGDIAISDRHGVYNYTFYEYSSKDVETADGESKKKEVVSETLSVVDITVEKAGEKTLTLKLPEKAIEVEKSYDGTPISVDLSGVKYMDGDKEITPKFIWTWDYAEDEVSSEEAIDGGTYYIYSYYDGDADYAPMGREEVATATIKPIELTVSVKQPLAEEVIAKVVGGNDPSDIFSDYTNNRAAGDMLTVSGYIAEDEDAFTKWIPIQSDEDGELKYNYPAWTWIDMDGDYIDYTYNQPQLHVGYGKESDYYGKLKGGETYTLNVDEDYLYEDNLGRPYCYNYTLKAGEPVELTAAYASSTVSLYPGKNIYSYNSLTVTDNETKGDTEQFVHDITFRESIPYTAALIEENGTSKTTYGNYATVKIQIPAEFEYLDDAEMAVYENALKNAGAITVIDGYNYITATFNLSKDVENGLAPNPVTFSIVWKEGFVEKFTITPTENNLAADLRNAVAPKSVAFNAPKTKMVVGEVQDLDVKITKVQNEDLVYLDYKIIDGEDVLAIGSQGRVTALKEGTATVQVYPVKIVNNSKEQITTVKPAQVKITVSKVAAPKIGTVTPSDESVKVQYPYVKNNGKYYDYGYRREVYVMAENKKTVAEFDAAISKFEQTGDFKAAGLAAAPVYISNDIEKRIADELAKGIYTEYEYENITGFAKGKNVTLQVEVDGLTPKTAYTIYVRNVSAQRTVLDKDGNKKIAGLSSNGALKDCKTTLGQVKMLGVLSEGDEKRAVLRMYDADEGDVRRLVRYYEYDLASAAGTQLTAIGLFSAVEAEVDKAEVFDYSDGYELPFTDNTMKAKLLEPKIEYHMYQVTQANNGSWEYVTHDYYDENSGDWYDADEYYWNGDNVFLNAAKYTKADKKGALKFAQPEALAVTAYDTVTKTESAPIIVRIKADADSATGKAITLQVGQKTPIVDLVAYKMGKSAFDSGNPYFAHKATTTSNDYLKVDANGNITPVKYEKTAAKQTVTVTSSEGPTVSGASTVTIKDLDPIKNLKFNNLIDNSFVLDFVPSIYAEGYIVDIKNASGNLVQRKYIPQYDEHNPYNDGFIWYYSAKKKAYTLIEGYGYEDWFKVEGLQAQCKYNVTVTAVYGDAESKAVSKVVTTTKIPAADSGIRADAVNAGMEIFVFANGDLSDSVGYTFVSGNRYTLVANANAGAQYAVTDKLTWSSSDSKVAKVSAVGGTYSASLKALKAGTTTIEVKSGILKQTIARWKITIRSVGDAYNNAYFYDENEDLRGDGTKPYNIEARLVLNVPTAVELAARESKTYEFVAEEAGNYKVVQSAGMGASISYGLTGMAKGGIGYVRVTAYDEPASGTITVEKVPGTGPEDRIPLKLNESVTIPANGWAVFTADEDADKLYNFAGTYSMSLYKSPGSDLVKSGSSSIDYAMKKKTSIYVKNTSSSDNAIKVTSISMPTLKAGEVYTVNQDDTYSWYTFTASEKADYRFKRSDNGYGGFSIKIYKDFDAINNDNSYDNSTSKQTVTLNAGDIVYVKVRSRYTDASFAVTKVEPTVITKDKNEYTVEASETTSYSITPETDAIYTFTLDSLANSIEIYLEGSEEKALKYDTRIRTMSYPLKAGTAYSIKVDNTYNYDLSLTVNKTVINALTVDEDAVAFSVPTSSSGRNGWLSFTVPQDGEGFYEFTLTKTGSGYRYIYVTNELSEDTGEYISQIYMNSSSATKELYLSAGQKLYLLANGNSLPSDVSVAVKKAGGTIQPFPTEAVTVAAGETAWFSYQVESDGRYSFKSSYTGGYAYQNCYEDVNKDSATSNERYWKAGSTVYVKVMNNSSTDSDVTLKINKIEPTAWTDADASQAVPGNNEEKWFAFTAPEETEYTFTCKMTNNSSSYIYLYPEKQFQSEGYSNTISGNSVTYPFTQGETVYIKTNSSLEAALSAEKAGYQELNDGENEVTSEGYDTIVKFTVPETGIYTFISDQSNGSLYLYTDKEAYVMNEYSQYVSGSSGKNLICYPLIKDTTVYLKISCYSIGNESAGSYNLTVKSVEMEEVRIGENTLTLTTDEKWIYCTVTDTETTSLYISYTSEDNGLYYIPYEYAYSYYNYNWQNDMIRGWMYNNDSANSVSVVNNLMLVKLTPYNSGKITLKISKDSN